MNKSKTNTTVAQKTLTRDHIEFKKGCNRLKGVRLNGTTHTIPNKTKSKRRAAKIKGCHDSVCATRSHCHNANATLESHKTPKNHNEALAKSLKNEMSKILANGDVREWL
jgi:hypothetical protein